MPLAMITDMVRGYHICTGSNIHIVSPLLYWFLAPQQFRYQHSLHLAGTFTNFVDFNAAPVARNRKFIHEAVAAMDLHGLVGSSFGRLRGKELGHRRLSPIGLALHMQPRGLII